MTERLTQLLKDESDNLDIPAPRADAVLGRGRAVRRRHRAAGLVAAAAVLGVVGGGAVVATQNWPGAGGDGTHATALSAAERYLQGGAYAVGSTVHFGDPANEPVHLEEKVKALYYTSGGVVVRTGKTPWTDDPGPSHYALVTPTGEVQPLDLDLGDRVPATDPSDDTMIYADGSQGDWEIVVLDVATGTEVKRVPFDGSFTWGGWEAPPVALAGDTAYVGLDDATLAVNLTNGEASPVEGLPKAKMPEATGGRYVVTDHETSMEVIDLATGDSLLTVDLPKGHSYGELSPDGRYLKLVQEESIDAEGNSEVQQERFEVYAVDSDDHVSFDQAPWDFGWTPDGHLLEVTRSQVTLCDPDTGDCTTQGQSRGEGEIKIAGNAYES